MVLTFLFGVISGAILVALVSSIITVVGRARTRKSVQDGPLLGVVLPPEAGTK